jgi:hypothetical protein
VTTVTARLEPIGPFDGQGEPRAWRVVSSQSKELRSYPATAKSVAETFAAEFNITAYNVDRRLRKSLSPNRSSRERE